MNQKQFKRIGMIYSLAVLMSVVMLATGFAGMLPVLILIGVVIGALHLCFTAFEFSDVFGGSGRREVIPPEPDYVVNRKDEAES
jgi:uncharacterized membrane protein